MAKTNQHPLITLYGEQAIDLATTEIEKLKQQSNIPFTQDYLEIGTSFILCNAKDILTNKKKKCSLETLVRKSFGEAAIAKYM